MALVLGSLRILRHVPKKVLSPINLVASRYIWDLVPCKPYQCGGCIATQRWRQIEYFDPSHQEGLKNVVRHYGISCVICGQPYHPLLSGSPVSYPIGSRSDRVEHFFLCQEWDLPISISLLCWECNDKYMSFCRRKKIMPEERSAWTLLWWMAYLIQKPPLWLLQRLQRYRKRPRWARRLKSARRGDDYQERRAAVQRGWNFDL